MREDLPEAGQVMPLVHLLALDESAVQSDTKGGGMSDGNYGRFKRDLFYFDSSRFAARHPSGLLRRVAAAADSSLLPPARESGGGSPAPSLEGNGRAGRDAAKQMANSSPWSEVLCAALAAACLVTATTLSFAWMAASFF